MKKTIAGVLVLTALIAGCAGQPKFVEMKNQFNPADYADYVKPGTNRVTGQAFLRQQGGGTVPFGGARVLFLPATPYGRESTDILARGGMPNVANNKPTPEYHSVMRHSVCDAQGNFEFEKIPPGKYIVMSEVRWTVGNSSQGGFLKREVNVVDGSTNRIVLSDLDR